MIELPKLYGQADPVESVDVVLEMRDSSINCTLQTTILTLGGSESCGTRQEFLADFSWSYTSGRLISNVLASVAAYENEIRSERIVSGQQAAKANGKKWGGSNPGRRVTVTTEAEATVRKPHAEGTGITAIANAVSLSRPTIYRLLGSSR